MRVCDGGLPSSPCRRGSSLVCSSFYVSMHAGPDHISHRTLLTRAAARPRLLIHEPWYCQHPQPTSETYLTQQHARRVHSAVPPVVVPLSTQLCLVGFMARFQGTAWVAFRPMFSRFDKIGQRVTDRRTDGRTHDDSIRRTGIVREIKTTSA